MEFTNPGVTSEGNPKPSSRVWENLSPYQEADNRESLKRDLKNL